MQLRGASMFATAVVSIVDKLDIGAVHRSVQPIHAIIILRLIYPR